VWLFQAGQMESNLVGAINQIKSEPRAKPERIELLYNQLLAAVDKVDGGRGRGVTLV
jgi:hypothetical protein